MLATISPLLAVLLSCALLPLCVSFPFVGRRPRTDFPPLRAYYLTSALDSLATKQNILSDNKRWLDPDSPQDASHPRPPPGLDGEMILPLYPLPAVYVPSGESVTYTLQNIEPRNIQMAVDLTKTQPPSARRFCTTLRLVDTGRMAQRGTILRVTDMEVKSLENGEIQKVVLTCEAEDVVDIVTVENMDAADLEYRLRRPREYLKALVRRVSTIRREKDHNKMPNDSHPTRDLCLKVARDFNRVREYLVEGFGTDDLPPFARKSLSEALPLLKESDLVPSASFWNIVYLWQTYAYTVREGYQQKLASDRNELLIAGALRQEGPLNLPVHITDLFPEDRQRVVELEQRIHQEWIDTGLEPVLDFQRLINLQSDEQRLSHFSEMVARERGRLTRIALLPRETSKSPTIIDPVVQKGAWFEE